jgi:hypothetical protein
VKTRDQHLSDLAEALLVRHLQASWPATTAAGPTWFRDGGPPDRYDQEIRTVAVVGAGASVPMNPVAEQLATYLEEKVDKDRDARLVELDRLEDVYGLERTEFETRLTAICRTPEIEREVRYEIARSYGRRHPTVLAYELLAHLLHHRFLDAIVSFNFDELLDQSIDDELGPDEYTRVVGEGDFDPDPMAELQGPLYVKMHGTASEPETLRFTRDRYYWTPASIVELVERQFDVEHLVLINLGFGMSSFDFQRLLRKPASLEIYHFDPRALPDKIPTAITDQRRKARERGETSRSPRSDRPTVLAEFPVDPDTAEGPPDPGFLGDLLGKLDAKLERLAAADHTGPAEWRSTRRHEAVVELLDGADLHERRRYIAYLRRRTVLEIAFTATKGRGVVSIASMVGDRCGRYYDLYVSVAGRERASSWSKLCEEGGLRERKTFPGTYEVLESVRRDPPEGQVDSPHRFHLADPGRLAAHTAKILSLPEEDGPALERNLTRTLEYLQHDTEIEIHSCDDRVCSKLFSRPRPLISLTAFQGWTREMLIGAGDFDELCLVAETGYWILEQRVKAILTANAKRIRLVQAFEPEPKIEGIDIDTRQLLWGHHNRHMTIACKDGVPQAAIYFVRRLRAATVTPVALEEPRDLQRVMEAFEELWSNAEVYERERKLRG